MRQKAYAWDPGPAAMGPETHTRESFFVETPRHAPPGAPAALRHGDRDGDRPPALDHAHAVDVPGLPRVAHGVRLQVRLAQALTLGPTRRGGGTGRRARLKTECPSRAWGFDPLPRHYTATAAPKKLATAPRSSTSGQCGSAATKARPYGRVRRRGSRIATTPRSSWPRISRPNPCRSCSIAVGSA